MSPDDTSSPQDATAGNAGKTAPPTPTLPAAADTPAVVTHADGEQHEIEAALEVQPPTSEEQAALSDAGFELRDHAWRPTERVVITA